MKVVVTGGAGFIGSHIVEQLLDAGHNVAVVDSLVTGQASNLPAGVRLHRVDLRQPELADVLRREAPEVVVHQAAQVGVPASVKDPLYDGEVNILGSVRLLEACRQSGTRKIVYASSCALYGDPVACPVAESARPQPLSPYGTSKLTVEYYLGVYQQLYGLAYTALRYANVYGPRQDPFGEAGVISIFAEAAIDGRPITIHGTGEQERDFVYVGDVAAANVRALDRADGLVLNVGSGVGTTVLDLYRRIARIAGVDSAPSFGPPRPGDIFRMVLDPSAAAEALGWAAATSLDDGLARTVAHFRAKRSQGSPVE